MLSVTGFGERYELGHVLVQRDVPHLQLLDLAHARLKNVRVT